MAACSAPLALRVGLTIAAIAIPAQMVAGDFHGLNTLEHQPQKMQPSRRVWDPRTRRIALLLADPDDVARTNHFEVAVPRLGSLILTHDPSARSRASTASRRAPAIAARFSFAFRAMVGVGGAGRGLDELGLLGGATAAPLAIAALRAPLALFAAMTFAGLGRDRRRLAGHRSGPAAVHRPLSCAPRTSHRRRRARRSSRRRSRCTSRCTRCSCIAYAALLEVHGREPAGSAGRCWPESAQSAAGCDHAPPLGDAEETRDERGLHVRAGTARSSFIVFLAPCDAGVRRARRLPPRRRHAHAARGNDREKDMMSLPIGPSWTLSETWLAPASGSCSSRSRRRTAACSPSCTARLALCSWGLVLRRRGVDFRAKGARVRTRRRGIACSSADRCWRQPPRAGCSGAT